MSRAACPRPSLHGSVGKRSSGYGLHVPTARCPRDWSLVFAPRCALSITPCLILAHRLLDGADGFSRPTKTAPHVGHTTMSRRGAGNPPRRVIPSGQNRYFGDHRPLVHPRVGNGGRRPRTLDLATAIESVQNPRSAVGREEAAPGPPRARLPHPMRILAVLDRSWAILSEPRRFWELNAVGQTGLTTCRRR